MSSKTPKYILLPAHIQINPRGKFSSGHQSSEPSATVSPSEIFPDYEEVRARMEFERAQSRMVFDEGSSSESDNDSVPDADPDSFQTVFADIRAALEDLSDGQTRDGADSRSISSERSSRSSRSSLASPSSSPCVTSRSQYHHQSRSSSSHPSSSPLSSPPSSRPRSPPPSSPPSSCSRSHSLFSTTSRSSRSSSSSSYNDDYEDTTDSSSIRS